MFKRKKKEVEKVIEDIEYDDPEDFDPIEEDDKPEIIPLSKDEIERLATSIVSHLHGLAILVRTIEILESGDFREVRNITREKMSIDDVFLAKKNLKKAEALF
jgi:hypothetical protein